MVFERLQCWILSVWKEHTFYKWSVNLTQVKRLCSLLNNSASFFSFLWAVALGWGICSLTRFLLGWVEDDGCSLMTWPRSAVTVLFSTKLLRLNQIVQGNVIEYFTWRKSNFCNIATESYFVGSVWVMHKISCNFKMVYFKFFKPAFI